MATSDDKHLGSDRAITRRDFVNGVALGVGGALASRGLPDGLVAMLRAEEASQSAAGAYYPPTRTGMRGSHDGSWEVSHSLRDGRFGQSLGTPTDTRETYDLVVVGGGISGLAAAHFFRARAGRDARVLVLDNHDDFGGHAKRNEFHIAGRTLLMNGGTAGIDSPTPYSATADGLLKSLGVDAAALAAKFSPRGAGPGLLGSGLRSAYFFDKETFGADKLVVGSLGGGRGGRGASVADGDAFLAKTPLSTQAQRDWVRVQLDEKIDYLPGVSPADKKSQLAKMSYRDYLLTVAKVHPDVAKIYQRRTEGEWGVGIDAEPALDCWGMGYPGFAGLELGPIEADRRMSYTAAGYAGGGSYRFHYPDGNASIARLLVRSLVPQAMPGHSGEDIVTAVADYSQLDRAESAVKIRLNSTVVRVRHAGDAATAKEVDVTYARKKQTFTVRARGVVMACWNMMIPFLCPDLPAKQSEAMRYLVKVPLVYTSIGLRNWKAFERLGVSNIASPGMWHAGIGLNIGGPAMGDYKAASGAPDEPILVHLTRTPNQPGLASAREQHKAGRMELLQTPFATFERNIRDQFARILGGGGFDPARDIDAIIVNRWPHGYGYEYNPLYDPEWAPGQAPHEIGRARFGRIAIANSDAGATAYSDVAIDQAYRAVNELFPGQSRSA
jgi:spermidine dehydrogenase